MDARTAEKVSKMTYEEIMTECNKLCKKSMTAYHQAKLIEKVGRDLKIPSSRPGSSGE